MHVFIRNLKTFNKVVGDYNTDLPEALKEEGYNKELAAKLAETYLRYINDGFKFVPFKIDFLADRSIPDNIEEEAS
jgi:hypothetical protein